MGNIVSIFDKQAEPVPSKKAEERFTRRKDGLYHIEYRYKDKSGKARKKSFYGKTQTEAINKRKEFIKSYEEGLRVDKANTTASQYIDLFLEAYKPTVKSKTYRQKEIDMELIRAEIGGMLLRNVTKTDAQAVLNKRAGMATEYIKKLKVSLNQLFAMAEEDKYIPFNPCAKLRMPRGTKTPHRELSEQERSLVLSCEEHRMQGLVVLMMFAGLRPGEAVALSVESVDFENNEISVADSVVFGSSEEDAGGLKTVNSYRKVPLVEPLRTVLIRETEGREKGRIFNTANGKEMTESSFRRGMESYLYTLGVQLNGFRKRWTPEGKTFEPVKFTAYDLRHTFCTMMYDAGVDLKTAVEWMGHADAQITLNIYTHLSREKRSKSVVNFASYAATVGKTVGKPQNKQKKNKKIGLK